MEKIEKKYVVDTSALIEKQITGLVQKNKIEGAIIVPHAVVAELEHQANRGLDIGFLGLEELQELQNVKKKSIHVVFKGERPTELQIKYAKAGEIDASIRNLAYEEKATLITADRVLNESAKAFAPFFFLSELNHILMNIL